MNCSVLVVHARRSFGDIAVGAEVHRAGGRMYRCCFTGVQPRGCPNRIHVKPTCQSIASNASVCILEYSGVSRAFWNSIDWSAGTVGSELMAGYFLYSSHHMTENARRDDCHPMQFEMKETYKCSSHVVVVERSTDVLAAGRCRRRSDARELVRRWVDRASRGRDVLALGKRHGRLPQLSRCSR